MQVVKFLYKGKLVYCGYAFFFHFFHHSYMTIWGQEEALKFQQARKNDVESAMDL